MPGSALSNVSVAGVSAANVRTSMSKSRLLAEMAALTSPPPGGGSGEEVSPGGALSLG
jgi:hypothetical protein